MGTNKGILQKLTDENAKRRAAPLTIKNPVLVYDPPEIIELRRELTYHPTLVTRLGNNEDDLPTIIGILAAEVDIAMDGEYTQEDLLKVTDLIINRLREKRGAVLLVRK